MLNKDELKVLSVLFDDLSKDVTISDISRILKQKYPQTYRTILELDKKKLIKIKKIGKSKVIKLDFEKFHPEYIVTELNRAKKACENKIINITKEDIAALQKNIICILFGSYADRTHKKDSDIDLLFVIPDDMDYDKFDSMVRSKFYLYKYHLGISPESGLFEMWQHPEKLTVGNEILKKHIILYGAEHYLNLLRKHHVG
jgi:predicted nucleotidyltransferase